jgi:hypothetical protein
MSGMPILVCLLAAAAGLRAQDAADRQRLTALMPERAPVRFYNGDDLYRYLDGGAEAYRRYGMAALAHQESKSAGADVTADVYDMGDPLRAFGIYSAERSPDYRFLDIGAEGYTGGEILNFLQGRYYVKLSAFGDGFSLEDLARGISRRIGGGRSLPAALDCLPPEGLVAHSQKYLVDGPVAPAVAARYDVEGAPVTLTISLARSAAEAQAQVERAPGKDVVLAFARGKNAVVVTGRLAHPEAFRKQVLARSCGN